MLCAFTGSRKSREGSKYCARIEVEAGEAELRVDEAVIGWIEKGARGRAKAR